MTKIVVGSDHNGFQLKSGIVAYLANLGYKVTDIGCDSDAVVDYPDIARKVAMFVSGTADSLGILICETGIGMSIAANKFKDIRAAPCRNEYEAQMARNHNDANIVCIGARTLTKEVAIRLVSRFLKSTFKGERHMVRLQKIRSFEKGMPEPV